MRSARASRSQKGRKELDQPVAPTETELKFTLEATDLAAFKALSFLAEARVANQHLEAIYLDTEDCRSSRPVIRCGSAAKAIAGARR